MRTRLCHRLGLELPIVQAPMGGASCPALAAAVSNAGGLGMLALSWSDAASLRREIRETRALTDRPFGVNLVLAWRQDERLAICLEEGVRIVSFFWGDPAALSPSVQAVGGVVLHTVASAAQAKASVAAGSDIIVAQGWEAGGHVLGEVATLPLVRAVVAAVGPAPVLAAGGIVDGQGLAAALALGAAGVWIGTRFLASAEANIHPTYRARLLAAGETDTAHTGLFDLGWPGAPHRVLRNPTLDAWAAAGRPASGRRPGEGEVVAQGALGPIVRYASATPTAEVTGAVEVMSLWAGQGVGQIHEVRLAGEIVRDVADAALRGAAGLFPTPDAAEAFGCSA
ncbi:MAG: nitronate monooxygenase [Phenylobacterium sp.]|uniref:NAD(P)H-dependent flavin oxidoreductase n=1 Tax=Phenylobacterium sp. TaxID=1871053 RepID=UPI002735FFE7|nr:nitronate monooxygenase [Phenylobacterium sp.]MDP3746685.1 nitronate monooxygenase [Phenylobacterium sp.]